MLIVNHRIRIPLTELSFTFARSSGPGGQNVNKVNTKVTMHWPVDSSPSLPDDVRTRFRARFRRRINKAGQMVVISQRFRDQGRNVADCIEKLREMLLEVATAPRVRRRTKPSKSSRERRLRDKRAQSGKKQLRRRPTSDE